MGGSSPSPPPIIERQIWQDVIGNNVECAVRKYLLDYLEINVTFAPEKKVRVSSVNYNR